MKNDDSADHVKTIELTLSESINLVAYFWGISDLSLGRKVLLPKTSTCSSMMAFSKWDFENKTSVKNPSCLQHVDLYGKEVDLIINLIGFLFSTGEWLTHTRHTVEFYIGSSIVMMLLSRAIMGLSYVSTNSTWFNCHTYSPTCGVRRLFMLFLLCERIDIVL